MDWQKIGAVAGVASAALAVVGLIVALIAWLLPQSPSAQPPTSTTDTSMTPAGSTTATSTAASTSRPAGYIEAYKDTELSLPEGSLGVRAFVNLDKPTVQTSGSPAPDEIEDPAEFSYDDEGRFSTVFTQNGAKVGFAGADVTTAEQCLAAANTRPIATNEPAGAGTKVEVGTRLCVLTDQNAVALLEITALGPKQPFGGTVGLRATLWKRA